MKHIKLFESFISNSANIRESVKVDLKTEDEPIKLKPNFLERLKKALGIEKDMDKGEKSEKIKLFQKKKKIKQSGDIDHTTVLSALKGDVSKDEEEKEKKKDTTTSPTGEKAPVKNPPANESYSPLDEAEINYLAKFSSQKNGLLRFINSTVALCLPLVNKKIDDSIPSKFEKCYTIDYLISSSEVCFSVGLSVSIKSFEITDISLSAPSPWDSQGYVKAKVTGKAVVHVFVALFGEKGIGDDFTIDIEQNVWLYKFSQIQVYPPIINISSSYYDLFVVWAWITNNKFKIENSLIGKYSWEIPIQKYVNNCFNDKGGPYIKDIPVDEIKKYINIS